MNERASASGKHAPGPWEILTYGPNVHLVRRNVGPNRVQYILNDKGNEKVFRKEATARAAIKKAIGGAA